MADHRRARAAMGAMGAPLPQGHDGGAVPKTSWDDWEMGNPNKSVGITRQTADKAPVPGVPLEEYVIIELTKEYTVEDTRANKANLKFVEYLNDIKATRLQIWESAVRQKKAGKNKSMTYHEIVRVKNNLKALMGKLTEERDAVVRAGGIPLPVPKVFSKTIDL